MKLPWKTYYYRVIGVAILSAGIGFNVDELINGPYKLSIYDHEFWGILMIAIGALLISRMPKGK